MKRLYPDQPIVGIGTVIIHEGKIVLIKRGNEPGIGKWTVPGGLVELGENLEQAVIRETKEETGLDVEKPRLIDIVSYIDLDEKGKIRYHYIIVDYFVQVKNGVAEALSDAVELRWVPIDEVENYDLTSSFRLFFKNNREKIDRMQLF